MQRMDIALRTLQAASEVLLGPIEPHKCGKALNDEWERVTHEMNTTAHTQPQLPAHTHTQHTHTSEDSFAAPKKSREMKYPKRKANTMYTTTQTSARSDGDAMDQDTTQHTQTAQDDATTHASHTDTHDDDTVPLYLQSHALKKMKPSEVASQHTHAHDVAMVPGDGGGARIGAVVAAEGSGTSGV